MALDFWMSCWKYIFIYFFVATNAMEAIAIPPILDSGIWETVRQEKEGEEQL